MVCVLFHHRTADIEVWGCFFGHQIILDQTFRQIRMHFSAGIHPCQAFPSNQDAFLRWNSSLPGISIKSGCISPPEFIPARHFLQIRMHFSAGIHPSKTFPSNQDEFLRRNSSPPRHFHQIRMNFSAGIHPPKTFPSNQDAFLRRNSSLQDISEVVSLFWTQRG